MPEPRFFYCIGCGWQMLVMVLWGPATLVVWILFQMYNPEARENMIDGTILDVANSDNKYLAALISDN